MQQGLTGRKAGSVGSGQLFQGPHDLVGAQRDQIIASYRLKAAVGQLTAQDIQLPVEPYEAEAYYSDVRNRLVGLGPALKGR